MGNNEKPKSRVPLYASLIIIVATILCYYVIPEFQDFANNAWQVLTSDDKERIKNWIDSFGWYAPLIIILAMIVQMFLIIIPSVILMVVSVLAYGPIWGSLLIVVSIYLASSIGYILGKSLGQNFVEKLLGKSNEKSVEDFIDQFGFWAVVVTRLNPFLSNDAISFVAGILTMGYWRFIGATILGILPLTIFIAILGKSTQGLQNGLLIGSIVSLIIFALYWYWKKNTKTS